MKRRIDSLPRPTYIAIARRIDVWLFLVVVFTIATPLTLRAVGAAVTEQVAELPNDTADQGLVISIDDLGEIRINQERVDRRDLDSRLKEEFEIRGDRTVFLTASPDLEFNDVAEVVDLLRETGASRVGLMPAPTR